MSVQIDHKQLVCDGGKGDVTGSDHTDCVIIRRKSWQVECKEFTVSCYNVWKCPTFDECYKFHLRDTNYCCEYFCRWTLPTYAGTLIFTFYFVLQYQTSRIYTVPCPFPQTLDSYFFNAPLFEIRFSFTWHCYIFILWQTFRKWFPQ